MSKKKPKAGSKQRKSKASKPRSKGGQHGSAVSLGAFRAEKMLASMVPGFVAWFEEGQGSAEEALDFLELIGMVVAEVFEVAAEPSVTSFTVDDTLAAMASLEDIFGEDIEAAAQVFHVYIDFLHERELWSGSEEAYDEVHALFGDERQLPVPDLPEIIVPSIPQAEELAAFEAMPLIRHVTALVQWIGQGRPVTGTGVLRLADIEAAARCVGVSARGVRQAAKSTDTVLPGMESPGNEDPQNATLLVRTMHDVPALNLIWHCLLAADLIEVRPTKVVPRDGRGIGSDSTAATRLEAYRNIAASFLGTWEEEVWNTRLLGTSIWTMHKLALTLGCSDRPMPMEKFELDPDAERDDDLFLVNAMAQMSLGHFREMEKFGLVLVDTHVRVPRHLWQTVNTVFADEPGHTRSNADYAGIDSQADIKLRPPTTQQKPTTASPVFQLKIMLKGSKPPVWRRVLVSSGESLYQVHRLVQLGFDWDDSHLHVFQQGGRDGTTYSSGYVEPSPWEEAHVDENTVSLAEVLDKEGDWIDYDYDFGDDWRHRITLEKVLDAEETGTLPLCTGGRGMAPAEDSGGLWGWANMVLAVNDPEHSEHEDYRAWLGLEDGEILDPKAFDKDAVNAVLGRF